MTINKTSLTIFQQLLDLLNQLNNDEYTREMDLLSKNSISKHVRHIIEFYECLFNGLNTKEINYDSRKRNADIENNLEYTIQICKNIQSLLEKHTNDTELTLVVDYGEDNCTSLKTTFFRELAYNIEHAIHHFAIIHIAVKNQLHDVQLASNFGIAYSTVKYQESQQCAQ